jgi:hypothetical protein
MDFEAGLKAQIESEIARLQKILALLNDGTGARGKMTARPTVTRRGRRKGSTLSAAARARISAAQKARWAKVKGQK